MFPALEDVTTRQTLTTQSWQVASIPANAVPKKSGSRIGLTQNKRANVAINVASIKDPETVARLRGESVQLAARAAEVAEATAEAFHHRIGSNA